LLSATSDVIVADIIEFLLILAIDGFPLGVEHCIGSDYPELLGLSSHDFELYRLEVASDNEEVPFFDWAIGVFEVGYEISFSDVALEAFDRVVEWQDMYFSEVGNVSCRPNLHHISKTNS
jgi:hypothetical protein